ncbi:helix-turn-helix transcriptional regulator [Rhodococcus sp. 14-2470-1b]|uniref:LuxR C-terminal-related transcriptional regulator n=1 Tax=Rhodococcus sp. 14-2470-1b TaxID=2023149 RepID=UPI000B9A4164|nr:LuxR C-terminal-related transcriptional regulator [Rhodococcus sp. 14-2470-1b]OZF42892.1 helix-turn-helix transcriptional regulator [Rhodococcus sp. 14-2470-1b]
MSTDQVPRPRTRDGVLRPRDGDALRAELRHIADASGVPVVFGGEVDSHTLCLSHFHGTRTRGLDGLVIPSRSGLGGRVLDQRRPAAVSDYRASMYITHDYDQPVLGEGLQSILAVPVVVAGASRAVMYAAIRERGPMGDRVADSMIRASKRLAQEIAVRDEVDRRLRLMDSVAAHPAAPSTSATETLREIHAELRTLSGSDIDEAVAARLVELSDRIAGSLRGPAVESDVTLSARETDVLAQIALGCTNAEAAARLSLRPETVKSYLRSIMSKTGTRTRHESVVAARRLGLLP